MPRDSVSPDDFRKLSENFIEPERSIVEERLRTNYKRDRYQFLSGDEAILLGAILDRVVPQDSGDQMVDLISFMDWAIPKPLGYGHRKEGLPDESTMFREGLRGVDETAAAMYSGRRFADLDDGDKDRVLRAVQEGTAQGGTWERIPSSEFFGSLMQKAVAGYCAHPWTWMRIGFYGPAYPEGYAWISKYEAEARHERKSGFEDL